MPRPNGERNRGFQSKWLSNARLWSATTRLLAGSWDTGEIHLTGVAGYLAVHHARLLISDSFNIPADQVAREDCPIDPDELAGLDHRFEGLRNEVAHLADFTESGRFVNVLHTRASVALGAVTRTSGRSADGLAQCNRRDV